MHYLFGIIVEESDKDIAREKAKDILDELGVCEWHEDDAGRWSDDYPENVIAATESSFFATVEKLLQYQKTEYEGYRKSYENGENETSEWLLNKLAKFVLGKPISYIFDAPHWTSRITRKMKEEYKNNPVLYNLVLFDIHN